MASPIDRTFIRGALFGAATMLLGFMCITLAISHFDPWPTIPAMTLDPLAGWVGNHVPTWISRNLGSSVIAFAPIVALYATSLVRTRIRLQSADSAETAGASWIAPLHLWSSTFFGVGVLWTTIGLRGALLHALGETGLSTSTSLTAFEIMMRLIDGGVLSALTTTIIGGAGAYTMAVVTQHTVALPIQRLVEARQTAQAQKTLELLRQIASGSPAAERASESLQGELA